MEDESPQRAVVDWRKFQQQLLVLPQFAVNITNSSSHKHNKTQVSLPLSLYQKLTDFCTTSNICDTKQDAVADTQFAEMQTSSPVLPPGKLDKTYASSLILAHLLQYVKT